MQPRAEPSRGLLTAALVAGERDQALVVLRAGGTVEQVLGDGREEIERVPA